MKTTEPFKFIGNYNIRPFIEKLPLLKWESYTERQKIRYGMQDTLTIPLIWDIGMSKVEMWPEGDLFADQVTELNLLMTNIFGIGEMRTCVLTMLPALKNIDMHFDNGIFFRDSHRVHIPITTNENVIFNVGGKCLNMKVGEMWEINNSNLGHGVFNKGATDRIHLMLDWKF